MAVICNGTTYYYVTDMQGDVIAILDGGGNVVVQYVYDAWGKLLITTGSMATSLGVHNPLRYRGYVYDHESCTTYALGYNVIGGSSIFPSSSVSKTYYEQILIIKLGKETSNPLLEKKCLREASYA